jgi:hypothetical protein
MTMKLQRLSTFAMAAALLASGAVIADDDWGWSSRGPGVAPVKNELYKSECSTCHFAYQPGLLPAASWKKLMAGLDDHFGENAELDAQTRKELTDYLVMNAADNVEGYRRSAKIARSIGSDAPLRITEVSYIRRKHNEIPMRVIKGNKEIGSLSNCVACHTRADTGSYTEREIRIPGIGRWED